MAMILRVLFLLQEKKKIISYEENNSTSGAELNLTSHPLQRTRDLCHPLQRQDPSLNDHGNELQSSRNILNQTQTNRTYTPDKLLTRQPKSRIFAKDKSRDIELPQIHK